MQHAFINTADIGPTDRYGWFADRLETMFGFSSRPIAPVSHEFTGRVEGVSTACLQHFQLAAENSLIVRESKQISDLSWGHYTVYRERGAGAWFGFADREIVTAPGDLLLYDIDAPMRTCGKGAYRVELWMLPHDVLDPHLPPMRPLIVHIKARSWMAGLVTSYVEALAGPLGSLSPAETAMVADHLGRLLAIACGAKAAPHRDAVHQAKLAGIKRYVERHLARPGLDAESAAAAAGISVRQLHLLFQPGGESFSQFLRRRRLAEIKATLESPLASDRSITDIALGWGFASLPTFYRQFGAEFGAAPSDVRRDAWEAREAAAPFLCPRMQ